MKIIYRRIIGKEDENFRIQEYVIEYDPLETNRKKCSICGEVSTSMYMLDIFYKKNFLVSIDLCEKCWLEKIKED